MNGERFKLRGVSQVERYFLLLLGFGFVLRMLLWRYGISGGDMGAWIGWGDQLWVNGFSHFYDQVWNDRLPGGHIILIVAAGRDQAHFLFFAY